MALPPLASTDDLEARGIDTTPESRVAALLDAASAAIRHAAGCAVTRQTSTVTLWTEPSRRIELPAKPVHSVSSVVLDGEPVTDYKLRGSGLWLDGYWQMPGDIPGELEVTFDSGYDEVPADVVDLCCSLVAGGLASAEDGYDPKRGMGYERIDDYQYGMATGDDEVVSVMELPASTRDWLRGRFAGGAAVVGTVR
ncbi:hypothetical protein [Isoptericola sp. QY 916]|uniref:hypothetical protein n=1 Tax=Isoptericola sp. QY 916 TaxID=2782570 RepID=UPI003D3013EE|nr:hypothetical protein [Isoptericola sp. QY 916]